MKQNQITIKIEAVDEECRENSFKWKLKQDEINERTKKHTKDIQELRRQIKELKKHF